MHWRGHTHPSDDIIRHLKTGSSLGHITFTFNSIMHNHPTVMPFLHLVSYPTWHYSFDSPPSADWCAIVATTVVPTQCRSTVLRVVVVPRRDWRPPTNFPKVSRQWRRRPIHLLPTRAPRRIRTVARRPNCRRPPAGWASCAKRRRRATRAVPCCTDDANESRQCSCGPIVGEKRTCGDLSTVMVGKQGVVVNNNGSLCVFFGGAA